MRNKGEKTRRAIVVKALALFSVKGYYNTSISDILSATGLTKGGFYGHFPSKEALWEAAYREAVALWKGIVLRGLAETADPLERVNRFIENDMRDYLGEDVFPGGCFFLNMLVELSGQSNAMSRRVRRGFDGAADMIASWLGEAEGLGMLRPGLDHREIGGYIMISINGAAALYAGTRDPQVWRRTIRQLRVYLEGLRAGPPLRSSGAFPACEGGAAWRTG